jgi:acetyl-CoA carboxylase biotin carboxyl carrier protein
VSLTAAEVAEIMRLVEESSFDELTLEMEGVKICLRRGAVGETAVPASAPSGSPAPGIRDSPTSGTAVPSALGTGDPPRTRGTVAVAADPTVHDVASPLLGTFYRAPKPGAPPFVEVGTQVEEGTVVAIIEVMKLMNTVRAGVRGTVTAILVADGALAEYGETLLRVLKAG